MRSCRVRTPEPVRVPDPRPGEVGRRLPDDESTIELVAGFEGCRGVWMLLDEEASTQREAHYTLFSLWDTKEQAESVSQRAGSSMAAMLDAWGATLARPPESEVLLVDAGRAV